MHRCKPLTRASVSLSLAAEAVGGPRKRGHNASAVTWTIYTCLHWTRKTGLHGVELFAAASCSLLRSDGSWRNLANCTLNKI